MAWQLIANIRGNTGLQGPPGTDAVTVLAGYRHTQSAPVALVQIVHGLTFRPAGVHCVDLLGQTTEPDQITYPTLGVTEVLFGAAFAGIIDLS